jgi:hypothetical protein
LKTIADIVSELTKAARDVHGLSEGEKLRLLGRAYVTIREGWEVVGDATRRRESSEAMDLAHAGAVPMHLHDDETKALLLEAAKVIREIEAASAKGSGAIS